ncbi:MAG: response regulator, partial [Gemmatimonadota bacterium]|nr:response regulator [Gemmatimonadota bacterium]
DGIEASNGASRAEGPGGWAGFKVLVVDDERDSRVLIRHYLEEFGCQVFTAADGEEGLRLAAEIRPDLITLDLIMPGITGWDVLKRLKSTPDLRAIPVVIVSVVANEGRGKLLGAVDLVTKPFEREDLLRVLWRSLGRRRGGRVLLMVTEEDHRAELERVVRRRGFDASTATRGDVIQILGSEAPDAVVIDLGLPGGRGIAALLELRADRVHTGLPVLVLTNEGINEKQREIVRELATVHAPASGATEALARLLDVSFPVDWAELES